MEHQSRNRRCSWRPIAGLLLVLAACSGQDDEVLLYVPDDEVNELGDLHAFSTPTPPDTPVGRQLAWIIEVVNRGEARLEPPEIDAHFDERFLLFNSHDEIISLFATTTRDDAPLTFIEVSPDTSDDSVLALVEGSRTHLTIGINVADEDGKITGLQFLALLLTQPL